MNHSVLFCLDRGNVEEIVVHGEMALVHGADILLHTANSAMALPARSLLKPFQFLAADLPGDAWIYGTHAKRFAACLGSTSATEEQVEMLREWYSSSDMQTLVRAVIVPSSYPYDEVHRVHLKVAGKEPAPIFHSCFSKHMGILQGCKEHGWPLEDYNSTAHPYHQKLLETLSNFLERPLTCSTVVDGCLLPTPVLTLVQLATLFMRLAASEEERARGVRELMMAHPDWIGGPKRVDTRLMQANVGRLIAKEGADGLLALGLVPTESFPKGLGLIVKLYSGSHPHFTSLALSPLLTRLGLTPISYVPSGQEIRYSTLVKSSLPS